MLDSGGLEYMYLKEKYDEESNFSQNIIAVRPWRFHCIGFRLEYISRFLS